MHTVETKCKVGVDNLPEVGGAITLRSVTLQHRDFALILTSEISINGVTYRAIPVQHGNERPRAIDM